MAVTGFGAMAPAAPAGAPDTRVKISTLVSGSTSSVSDSRFEKKEAQHERIAAIYEKYFNVIRVFVENSHQGARNAALAAGGIVPGSALDSLSGFDDENDPLIAIIPRSNPEESAFVYVNNQGERISERLSALALGSGAAAPDPAVLEEMKNDVTEMIKILKEVKVLSSGAVLPARFFTRAVPITSLRHNQEIFDYIGKGQDLLKAFLDEMLKNLSDEALREIVKQELIGNAPVLIGPGVFSIHERLLLKCDELHNAIKAKVEGMPDGDAKAALDGSVNSADIFAAKMLVIMRHIRDRHPDVEIYARCIQETETTRDLAVAGSPQYIAADATVTELKEQLKGLQAGHTQQLGQALNAFVQAQRTKYESRDGLLDVKYYMSNKVIDEDQKSEEDQFINHLIKLIENGNPQGEPGSIEDILVVGPLQTMKTFTFTEQQPSESPAIFAARRAKERADIVRLDKLIGYGTRQFHYDRINAVRRDNPAGNILYPVPQTLAQAQAVAQPAEPEQHDQDGDSSALNAIRMYGTN